MTTFWGNSKKTNLHPTLSFQLDNGEILRGGLIQSSNKKHN
jgi:hypothetical protein